MAESTALELKTREAADQHAEQKSALSKLEQNGHLIRQRLTGYAREQQMLVEQLDRAKHDFESGQSQLGDLRIERIEVAEDVARLDRIHAEAKQELADAESVAKSTSQAYLDARAAVERCLRQEAQQRHEVTRQEYRIKSAQDRLNRAGERQKHLDAQSDFGPRLEELTKLIDEQGIALEDSQRELAHLEGFRENVYQWSRAFEQKVETLTRSVQQKLSKRSSVSARTESLERMLQSADSLTKGTQTLLNSLDDAKLLVDLFRGTPEYTKAFVSALGSGGDAVVVSSFDEALSALEKVAQNDLAVSLVTEEVPWHTTDVRSDTSANEGAL